MSGALNPCPYQVGGGPTLPEKFYTALRRSLGELGAAKAGGIDDAWRIARALTLAAACSTKERAFFQAFPGYATDHLPVYEALLLLPGSDTLAEGLEAAELAYTASLDLALPGIRADLRAMDPQLDVTSTPYDQAITTRYGKPFQVDSKAQRSSDYPAFSTNCLCCVQYSGSGGVVPEPLRSRVVDYLNAALPSWVDWRIFNHSGFFLDGFDDSKLDATAMGS